MGPNDTMNWMCPTNIRLKWAFFPSHSYGNNVEMDSTPAALLVSYSLWMQETHREKGREKENIKWNCLLITMSIMRAASVFLWSRFDIDNCIVFFSSFTFIIVQMLLWSVTSDTSNDTWNRCRFTGRCMVSKQTHKTTCDRCIRNNWIPRWSTSDQSTGNQSINNSNAQKNGTEQN